MARFIYDKLRCSIKEVPLDAFDNDLKRTKLSIEEYNQFQKECEEQKLITVLDLLKFYNNRDVEPFVKACVEYRNFFYAYNLEMYKDAFTLSGLAAKIMNQYSLPDHLFEFKYPPPQELETTPNIDLQRLFAYAYQDKIRNQKKGCDDLVMCPIPNRHEVRNLLRDANNRCVYCWKELNTNDWSLDSMDS